VTDAGPAPPSAGSEETQPLAQRLGAVLWPSFFAAGIATMVFFAFVDPLALRDMTFPELPLTRKLGYSLGFFMFWVATCASSLFTSILLSPGTRINKPLSGD
jgi:peptidoglycan/LPS O-acetylase OafA/YrhL